MKKNMDELIDRSPLRYNMHQTSSFRKEELISFADAIIRECMFIVERESLEQGPDIGKRVTDEIWSKIRNHFEIN